MRRQAVIQLLSMVIERDRTFMDQTGRDQHEQSLRDIGNSLKQTFPRFNQKQYDQFLADCLMPKGL